MVIIDGILQSYFARIYECLYPLCNFKGPDPRVHWRTSGHTSYNPIAVVVDLDQYQADPSNLMGLIQAGPGIGAPFLPAMRKFQGASTNIPDTAISQETAVEIGEFTPSANRKGIFPMAVGVSFVLDPSVIINLFLKATYASGAIATGPSHVNVGSIVRILWNWDGGDVQNATVFKMGEDMGDHPDDPLIKLEIYAYKTGQLRPASAAFDAIGVEF